MSASVRCLVPICGMATDSGWVSAYGSWGMSAAFTGTSRTSVSGVPVARSSTYSWPALVPMISAGTLRPSAIGKSIRLGCIGRSKSHRSLCTVW